MAQSRFMRLLRPRRSWWLAALIIALAALHVGRRLRDPNIVLLMPEGGAQWMRVDAPMSLRTNLPGERRVIFRTQVNATSGAAAPQPLDLTVRALRRVEVQLNGRSVFDSGPDLALWKRPHHVRLDLPAGQSELVLLVTNRDGPAMALAHADAANFVSGTHWEASTDGKTWSSVATADTPPRFNKPAGPRSIDALLRIWPCLIPFALLGGAWGWFQPRWITPARLCLALLVAWIVLAANNLPKLPAFIGYDVDEHVRYIDYIARHKSLPLADQGWQMFQSPLYYLISAPLFASLDPQASDETVMRVLRIIPMLCGAVMIVLCWFAARYALPGRRGEQCLAVLVGGLLPMNLYMAQNVSNEPLSGCLTALAIVLMLRYLRRPRARTDASAASAGASAGLALLAKVSAVLLVPVMAWTMWLRRRGARRVLILLCACAIVCGWYYTRNVIHFGKPFVAGWEPGRIPWWQEPGYRTPASFLRFGRALVDPLYAGVNGFWDSLYSTPTASGRPGITR